jgi:protein O-GlcNAc transferase
MSAAFKRAKRLYGEGRMQDALVAANEAITKDGKSPDAMLLMAKIFEALGDRAHAGIFYAGAIDISPKFRRQAAFLAAQNFLAVNDSASALGALRMLERYMPDNVDLNHWLCSLYHAANSLEEALPYARVLAKTGKNFANWQNAGVVLSLLQHYEEAFEPLKKAYEAEPKDPQTIAEFLWCAANLADLQVAEHLEAELKAVLAAGGEEMQVPENAFRSILWSDDEQYQLRCSKRTSAELLLPVSENRPEPRASRDKIRVGYVSSDFYNHATMLLFAGVLEAHDKDRFEIYGICYTPKEYRGGKMRDRFTNAVDHFVDIVDLDDGQAAERIRALDLDILVDLKGFTENTRLGIFCRRPAPVQITYLGFPGTVADAGIDYALTDDIVTPASSEPYFDETLLRLSPSYQCNDSNRPVYKRTGDRTELGLPKDAIVFCSFNQFAKFKEPVFAAWMEVLRAVEESVLWLLKGSEAQEKNLRDAATRHDVDPSRLIFAPKLPSDRHMERLAEADIALDTAPCSGHTTTSDALWCGVPVVTVKGTTFAGRVSESLLHAVGLDELVTEDLPAFVKLAVELARDTGRQDRLRRHLVNSRKTSPLFDTEAITRQIETHFENIVEENR